MLTVWKIAVFWDATQHHFITTVHSVKSHKIEIFILLWQSQLSLTKFVEQNNNCEYWEYEMLIPSESSTQNSHSFLNM